MLDTSKIYPSNKYGPFRIVNYIRSEEIQIEFLDTGYTTFAESGQIYKGEVKDYLVASVYGVGYIGDGHYVSQSKGKMSKVYNTWRNMLARCYSPTEQARSPAYIGCSVATIWHNFQNFAKWYEEHYQDGLHLDKDIKIKGNRVYSPDACMFVSQLDNGTESAAKHYKLVSPEGVSVDIHNLKKYCKGRSLDPDPMSRVARGLKTSYKGWTRAGMAFTPTK